MQKSALVYALSFLFCDTLRKSHLWSMDYKNQEKRRILFFVNQVLRDASETCGLVIFPIRPAKKETQGYDFVIHEKQKRRTYA